MKELIEKEIYDKVQARYNQIQKEETMKANYKIDIQFDIVYDLKNNQYVISNTILDLMNQEIRASTGIAAITNFYSYLWKLFLKKAHEIPNEVYWRLRRVFIVKFDGLAERERLLELIRKNNNAYL